MRTNTEHEIVSAAQDLNEAAIEFAANHTEDPLSDGTSLRLQRAAVRYAERARLIQDSEPEPLFGGNIRWAIRTWKNYFRK